MHNKGVYFTLFFILSKVIDNLIPVITINLNEKTFTIITSIYCSRCA